MSRIKSKGLRIFLIIFSSFIGLLLLIIIFLSPIAKFLIQKYDQRFLGREVTLDWIYINPLTGYTHINDLKVYEQSSDSVFFSASGISVDITMTKLLKKEYEIADFYLDQPMAFIVQHSANSFNFSDILDKFKKDTLIEKVDTSSVRFSLLAAEIKDGTFILKEEMTPINFSIEEVNVKTKGPRWDADSVVTDFSFKSGIGEGSAEGTAAVNLSSKDYRSHIIVKRFDLAIIEQYAKVLAKYGSLKAMINADITASGNFKDVKNVDASGGLGIYEMHFGKSPTEDIMSFKKFVMKINHINPLKKIYVIDSISLVNPYLKYEKYDVLDNIQNMFGEKGENVIQVAGSQQFNLVIELARYIKLVAQNFFHSDYKVNRLGVYNANLQYEDYSLKEKFSVSLHPLTLIGDSMNSNRKRVYLKLRSGIQPYGSLKVDLGINPKDSSDFELKYNLDGVNASLLNPYLVSYTSYPLDRGSIGFSGAWSVLNGKIKSTNHLLIVDPRVSQRVKTNQNKWLPLRAAMFFVRERGNAIDYQIPVTGNLKDPRVNFKDVIWDIVTNIFVKPATTPYSFVIRNVENKIERTIGFNWERGTAFLLEDQEAFVEDLADFLLDYPNASIKVFPVMDEAKEKEHILLYEARKKYFLSRKSTKQFSENDSLEVVRMDPKDANFIKYLRNNTKDNLVYTTQELCQRLIGAKLVEEQYNRLLVQREKVFLDYFRQNQVEKRVQVQKTEARVPFNGFSFYRVSYNGAIPPDLKEAFEELREFDNQKPRKKFQELRRKTRRFFKTK